MLTIAWGVVGYFGVFDMGLSNAMTKFVAERIGLDPSGGSMTFFIRALRCC